ncbi:GNAT family N-acetyltransferase [Amaricoccus sp.]|uniref:GNAT family N-acetyltransferase n=1 Tax=Amaricoccus sp. TaxID=1872485 RepID=UPI001B45F754|nr:N-acetyltransferase [Amaricoccus sp.]MBP7001083.1 N-acetyltransferase [Amaricoccus sp.]
MSPYPTLRAEAPADHASIRALTDDAFAGAAHASGTEGAIVDALREAGALALSLVAEEGGAIVGHVAFSPVAIPGAAGWFGLGPVAVRPDRQGRGIGAALIRDGLARLEAMGAQGCVLLGDPGYYRRFGFAPDPRLRFEGAPPEYFLRLAFPGAAPAAGAVAFHAAFHAA